MRTLIVLLLLALPAVAQAAIVEVGGGTQRASFAVTGVDSRSQAFPAAVTAGSLVVFVGASWATGSGNTSVTCSKSSGTATVGPFTAKLATAGGNWASGVGKAIICYALVTGPGTLTLLIDPNGTANDISGAIDEFSGVDTTTPLDVDGGQSSGTTGGGGGDTVTEAITTTTANALVIGVIATGPNTLTPNWSGGTQISEYELSGSQPHNAQFQVVTTAMAYNVTWQISGASQTWGAITLAFRVAGAAANKAGSLLNSDPLKSILRGGLFP